MIARRQGDHRHLAEALGNVGVMYYYQGDYDLAFDFLDQAEDAIHELGLMLEDGRFRNEASVRYGIAMAHTGLRLFHH